MGNKAVISKQHILETAYDLFRAEETSSLSIRGVAAACGVSVGSIYNYFPTKSALVAEIVEMFWRESLHKEMFIATSDENFVTFCERLLEDLRATLEIFHREWLSKLMALDTESVGEIRRREEAAFVHIRRGLTVVIRNDKDIKLDVIGGEEGIDRLATLVWSTIVTSLEHGDESYRALFALIHEALYD